MKQTKLGLLSFLMGMLPTAPRLPGPDDATNVSSSAIARWESGAEQLPEHKLYRPQTLAGVRSELDALKAGAAPVAPPSNTPLAPTPEPTQGSHYRVVRGDILTELALKAYHSAAGVDLILKANAGILSDPDRIYVG